MATVGFLVHTEKNLSPEEQAAWSFLSKLKSYKSKKVSFGSISSSPSLLRQFDVLWWHYDSTTHIPDVALDPLLRLALKRYVEQGKSLLLSLLAAQYVADLEFEPERPNLIEKGAWQQESWAKDYPDIRGFASYQGHPVFAGLGRGFYTWNPSVGSEHSAAVYNETAPQNGSIVAVERLYIKLNDNWRIMNEYKVKKGNVLTVGTFCFFREPRNRFRKHLEKFLENCLSYLAASSGKRRKTHEQRTTYWTFEPPTVQEFTRKSKPPGKINTKWQVKPAGLLITRDLKPDDEDQFFDVGGRRALIMGKERGGLSEVWCHPVRILRDARVGLKVGGNDVKWSDSLDPQVTVQPESLTRVYHIGETVIEETVFGSLDRPGGAMHFRVDSKEPVELLISATVDLRLMWPLNERATGSLNYAWDKNLQAAVVSNRSRELWSIIGCSAKPAEQVIGQFSEIKDQSGKLVGEPTEAIQVAIGLKYSISTSNPRLTIAFAGSNIGENDAMQTYTALLRDPTAVLHRQSDHFKELLDRSVRISTPDKEFNEGYRWAICAADRFYVDTPGVGKSLVAGYGLSTSGWDGGHKVSGRPGYAWYFGRDSAWSCFALLEYGDAEKVRNVIEFLGTYQDLSGKILHELTTSGYSHYDSADATPLYIILMGRYARATGDVEFVRKQFSRLLKAVEFCFSTDTDKDHLIENTNVGHGWVEGGKLFPVHTEHYLASCWAAALDEASFAAEAVRKKELSKKWKSEAKKVREVILKDFWNPQTEFYNFGKYKDGTYNTERTVLPAVGMSFGIAEQEKVNQCIKEYASANFTADWGARIVGKNNAMYNPAGYHEGSVWPLFTGWVSLAEFRWNRPVQGFIHAMSNLLLYKSFSRGYVAEVLDGEKFQPAGVCPHQAWSETMVLQPALEGMLGLSVDARNNRFTVRPYVPPQWNSFDVQNMGAGKNRLHMMMKREEGKTTFKFKAQGRRLTKITFQPRFPPGTEIVEVAVGSKKTRNRFTVRNYHDFRPLEFTVSKSTDVIVYHRGGIDVIPHIPHPNSHEESHGLRIMEGVWESGTYALTVEGKSGEEYPLEVSDPAGHTRTVEGAALEKIEGGRIRVRVSFEALPGRDYLRKVVRFLT